MATDRHRLIRMVRGIRGKVKLEARVEPRFDYGRATHKTTVAETGAVFDGGSVSLALSSTWPVAAEGDDVRARFTVKAGESGAMILESGKSPHPAKIPAAPARAVVHTDQRLLAGLARRAARYRGRWREAVERSAITLKLCSTRPTGGLVAAPTAGLPEQVGGERNWDYRYTWIRDASFSVFALLGLGFTDEAAAFVVGSGTGSRSGPGERLSAGHHVSRRRQLGSGGVHPRSL